VIPPLQTTELAAAAPEGTTAVAMAVLEVTVVQEAMVVGVDTEEVAALVVATEEAVATVAMGVVAVAVAEELEAVEAEDTVVEVPYTFLVRFCSVSDFF
jgi:hypothetical protein